MSCCRIAGRRRGRRLRGSRRYGEAAGDSIPWVARLMALAIRFDGLLREETIQDYAGRWLPGYRSGESGRDQLCVLQRW